MRQFARPEAFDLVINMFTAFGYFDDKEDDLLVLRNIYASLREGGVFVIDTMGKEWLAKGILPTTSEELADGKVLVQRHEIFDDWSRIRNEWILDRRHRCEVVPFSSHGLLWPRTQGPAAQRRIPGS